jgi:hypothetical protein
VAPPVSLYSPSTAASSPCARALKVRRARSSPQTPCKQPDSSPGRAARASTRPAIADPDRRTLSHHIWHERLEQACEKRHSILNFSYVCPEPVLVKCSFCYKNGSSSGVFRTDAWAIGPVHAEPAENVSRFQLLLYVCPEPVLAKKLGCKKLCGFLE